AQLTRYRPDLEVEFIVGSLNERLQMVHSGKLRGVVVAAAGIEWRGWQHLVSEVFTSAVCIPAVGQAALGVLVREGDEERAETFSFLNHTLSRREVDCERSFYESLGAWEGAPVGGLARVKGDILRIEGCVCALDGSQIIRSWAEGFPDDPLRTGERLGAKLLDLGARELLAEARSGMGLE
ncbi:MAG: hydroxymethylbilane synthase, partial [Candidatus Eisenbacteria bacterium]|nr:hydroxymethylbilane synthase [Candidatus Eisenbacteria bacterium]